MNEREQKLKLALARMLPEKICIQVESQPSWFEVSSDGIRWSGRPVQDTEWLHVCWLIEEKHKDEDQKNYLANEETIVTALQKVTGGEYFLCYHATWQQRAEALCKVKGIVKHE